MSTNVSGTDRIIEFLKQHMLAKFCIQWPLFSKLIDRFGEEEVLATYAEKLAGRGYKTVEIKTAIDRCTQNDMYYPKPYVFAKMVKSPNFKPTEVENRALTPSEQQNVARIISQVKSDDKARLLHQQMGTDFASRGGDTKQHYRRQIEKVAEQLLGRPLSK